MTFFLGFIGIICSIMMIVQRERVADMIGSGAWMDYVGGVYNFVVILAVVLFFGSVAVLTGTTSFFLSPILWLLPTPANNATNLMP